MGNAPLKQQEANSLSSEGRLDASLSLHVHAPSLPSLHSLLFWVGRPPAPVTLYDLTQLYG